MYYFDGRHKFQVKEMRDIDPANFSQMVIHLLNPEDDLQVLVDGGGGERWINIRRNQLYHENGNPVYTRCIDTQIDGDKITYKHYWEIA